MLELNMIPEGLAQKIVNAGKKCAECKYFVHIPWAADLCGCQGHVFAREESGCTDFIAHGKQSNAERIRSMTDRELAEWLNWITNCEECPVKRECENPYYTTSIDACINTLLGWLKQEAKDA